MTFAALPDFLLDGFDLYPKDEVLRMLLRPIKKTSPHVLVHGRFLHRSLKRIGCVLQLPSLPSSQPPDVVCGRKMHRDLKTTLQSYLSSLSQGGLVLLITLRSEMPRENICAAFLHAGIVDPVQESTRVFVLTAGVVTPPSVAVDGLRS